ncbi:hypothetical protein FB548_3486 [Pseudoxanthomonas sp. 3HH-4]|uniref:hypothetical protein n=1 Tax=Pseudoxanthomonas sp. 3HH-4 TaxID=1690214 RepID=UPI00114E5AEB|nr:hypothetical protein [Pseudoxanthomonas sp. 3HH-4]TQM05743.1 hypothetical protein FB548_3486 [Pseudoxanthomonas sp. 3HH-4]
MRWLVLLLSLAMPVVSWLSQQGMFGPTNGAISDRYPTLIVAAGYAFAIWGLIFLWDVAFSAWQAFSRRAVATPLAGIRPWAAAGFALTAVWMPVFSLKLFWLALPIIWGALACLLVCALTLSAARTETPGSTVWAWAPLSLHAGWLSMAAFLNTAQVIVAYRLLPTGAMLPWTLVLFVAAAALLLWANHRMRGNLPFAAAALWALAAVYVKQSDWTLRGSDTAAMVAIVVAIVLAAQTAWLRLRPQPRASLG